MTAPDPIGVDADDVRAAAVRIESFVHHTPVLRSATLDRLTGQAVFFKAEHVQRTGAFKLRGATNAIQALDAHLAARGVAAHSSGNHAQAVAFAARQRGVPAHVVMPEGTSAVKLAAVRGYGADVTLCEPTIAAREGGVAAIVEATGATEVHPYDDRLVIAGAGTAALELLADVPGLDAIVAPVGGGGLLSGTVLAARGASPATAVWGAEPQLADDAARSLATGVRQPEMPPLTIADGVRTALSERTFAIIRGGVAGIAVVSEAQIVDAMRFAWMRLKQVIEPSAAVALAAVLASAIPGDRIGVILSGGNVDLDHLPW